MRIDIGMTAADYARHRAGFPEALFRTLNEFGIGGPGERALDLGTGTGTLARGLARQGGRVTAIDPSVPMVQAARRLDAEAGVSIRYRVAMAEATGLDAGAFEVVTAGQCWHWFDGPAAASEARRVLMPGGRLVICHFDYIPLPGNLAQATEALVLKHNPGWSMAGGTGFYPSWASHVAEAGFEEIETFSFDVQQPYSHEDWRGRMRTCNGVGASLAGDRVEAFDRDLKAMLEARFPDDPLHVLHRVWALVCRAPG